MNTEVFAQLHLSSNDCSRLRDFLSGEFGILRKYILRKMHITVYYSRRFMLGVFPLIEDTNIIIPAPETRFMVMAPGGENPRQDVGPANNMIGIRVQRQSSAMPQILSLRQRLLHYETKRVLGGRKPSTKKTSAFGARCFQPHMVILRPGHCISSDLSNIGIPFREKIENLCFDKFEIKIVHREDMRGLFKNAGQHFKKENDA
jgi:hypothetical protein